MANEKALYKHAFWLYGVIIGLAIKEALEATIPHLIDPSHIQQQLTPEQLALPQAKYGFLPDLSRLIIFLTLVVRFYLGSVFFFTTAYEDDESSKEFKKKNYALDFVSGFMHFIGFVILALAIDIHTKPLEWFPITVGFILLYDLLWYFFCYKNDTSDLMVMWTAVNVLTFVLSGFIYLLADRIYKDAVIAENFAFIPVFIFSCLDLAEMMLNKPLFSRISEKLNRRRARNTATSEASNTPN